jgi:hypothetical protein
MDRYVDRLGEREKTKITETNRVILNYVLHSMLSLSTVSQLTGVIVTGKSQEIKIIVKSHLAIVRRRSVTEDLLRLSL